MLICMTYRIIRINFHEEDEFATKLTYIIVVKYNKYIKKLKFYRH